MKKKKLIKFTMLLLTITICSCFLFPKPRKVVKTGPDGEKVSEIRLTALKEGTKGKYKWAKSGDPRPIKDKYNKVISELDGHIRYSYVFSPIDGSPPVANIIVFETTVTGDSMYEVEDLALTAFEGVSLNSQFIPKKESSEDRPEYVTSYNFGGIDGNLNEAFVEVFDPSTKEWRYMLANLTVRNKTTGEVKTYEISLNPELFNDTIFLIMEKYPEQSGLKFQVTDGVKVKEPRLTALKEGSENTWIEKNIKWAKSGDPKPIKDKDNKVISELDGNIRYSYVFSNMNRFAERAYSKIVFETTVNGDSMYEVKDLALINFPVSFEKLVIPKKESSKDSPEYVNAYNFGTINISVYGSGYPLNDAFGKLFEPSTKEWTYMLASLTVRNKNTGKDETYTISLNPELFNDTVRLIMTKLPKQGMTIPAQEAP